MMISEASRGSTMKDVDKTEPDAIDENRDDDLLIRASRDRSTRTSIALANLGLEVCNRCGWQPTTASLDPNRSFGNNVQFGTNLDPQNWLSPIHTIMERRRRVRTTGHGTTAVTVYRKAMLEIVKATVDSTDLQPCRLKPERQYN